MRGDGREGRKEGRKEKYLWRKKEEVIIRWDGEKFSIGCMKFASNDVDVHIIYLRNFRTH